MYHLSSVRQTRSRSKDNLLVNARRGFRMLIAAVMACVSIGPAMVSPVSAATTSTNGPWVSLGASAIAINGGATLVAGQVNAIAAVDATTWYAVAGEGGVW